MHLKLSIPSIHDEEKKKTLQPEEKGRKKEKKCMKNSFLLSLHNLYQGFFPFIHTISLNSL